MSIRSFADWGVKLKLLIITAGLILGSVFLVSALSYLQYTRDFEKQSSDRIQQIIDQVSINIDTYLDDVFRLSLAPYRNDAVMDALDRSELDSEIRQLEKRWLVERFLDEMMIIPRKDILGVLILTDDIYYSGRITQGPGANRNYREYEWYRQAMQTQEHIFVPALMQEHTGLRDVKLFSVVKQIRSTRNTENVLGVIKVDANYKGIEDIAHRVDMGKDGGLYVLDDKGYMIYASTKQNSRHQEVLERVSGDFAGHITMQAAGADYLVNSATVPLVNWTVIAVNSVKELNKEASHTRNFAFLMAVFCSMLAIVSLYFFVKKVMNPLLDIVKLMKEFERGNLSVRFADDRRDEIGYLGSSFNALVSKISGMLEQNTSLVKEVYETKLLQKDAQIQTLYNQIRPHFIFNTLNMISLSMQSGKQDRAVDHIEKLSSILRSMTAWDREIPLQREIELLDAYLSIQSSRYEGRLEYDIDITAELLPTPIPALLFQPVVENAVIHGCETKRGKTTIRITGRAEFERMTFIIADDGYGMESEVLEKLKNKLQQSPNTEVDGLDRNETSNGGLGIGLVNVHRRIQLKYGQAFGLNIESSRGEGTKVIITLPIPT